MIRTQRKAICSLTEKAIVLLPIVVQIGAGLGVTC